MRSNPCACGRAAICNCYLGVIERGTLLNQLLDQRNAAWKALQRIAALNPEDYFSHGDAVKIAGKALRSACAILPREMILADIVMWNLPGCEWCMGFTNAKEVGG